ncbi:hypothetical protein EfmGK941_23890 [Enterococcus faecium]|nr:hypothetical protein EfmGK941_23890 [Enterococcus faecium]
MAKARERKNIAVKIDPLEMIYYNKDGSRAPMCGNGIRCFARYVNDQNMMNEQEFNVFGYFVFITIFILIFKKIFRNILDNSENFV